jgi:hypothetical protein
VDAACQPQPRQTGGGEDDCVVVSGVKFSQTRINVSSNFQKLQIVLVEFLKVIACMNDVM